MGEHISLGELIGKEVWVDHDVSYEVFSAGPLIGSDSEGYMVELELRKLRPHPHVPDHFNFTVIKKDDNKDEAIIDLAFFSLQRPSEEE